MYCENHTCRRVGLNKAEVEKDQKSGLLLCLGCYSLANPDWRPPPAPVTGEIVPFPSTRPQEPAFDYTFSFDSFRGLSAQVTFGEVAFEVTVPQRALKGLLGAR